MDFWYLLFKKNQDAIYVELESGGNDFKSCSVQIFTKHSTELLTEYQFCFFSYTTLREEILLFGLYKREKTFNV